jgi:hypothetical protein
VNATPHPSPRSAADRSRAQFPNWCVAKPDERDTRSRGERERGSIAARKNVERVYAPPRPPPRPMGARIVHVCASSFVTVERHFSLDLWLEFDGL